ncbi:helix-turn-helix protein [Actinomadura pelletieri DSM 43383]|uniref:Helix-turn-helix protein n=1 Tax=Actinomadura pelletieri DSM 43383 TaxID=1120940 RepID=A0A495QWY6_9ACTN|nr:helix-turn-helix transcriptional regulator [Actinomadura pelletieri]RKS78648.1 helix-turn-helix protein [Actinomadura pelletieri DSM 43383]
MIRNERQYRATMRQRNLLAQSLDELINRNAALALDVQPDPNAPGAQVLELQRASIAGQLADLDSQLMQYQQLQEGQVAATGVSSLEELPDALIRARIAAGMSQRDLAERLGMKEQQIQRYEAERYASASLTRLREITAALGVEFVGDLQLPVNEAPVSRLRKRLLSLGFDRRVVDRRLLRDVPGDAGPAKVLAAAERAARLLNIPVQQLLSSGPAPALATTGRFNAPRNAAHGSLDAYTRYAESLADLVLRATEHLSRPRLPGDAQSVRAAIDAIAAATRPDTVTVPPDSQELFLATLRYAADIGVPVLALRDPGAFHGACFSRDGRSVIVVKHSSDSVARWLALLLHELCHLADRTRGELRTWVELGDIDTWSDNPEEQRAHAFAADVLLFGRGDAVLAQAVQAAEGSVERLKAVVPAVADNAEVPVDILANYLAFQLGRRGINWWGTASTFQIQRNPWRNVTDQLLTQLDFNALDSVDRSALFDALAS